jgi:ParB-like chromosome segregation protein Spo0J
MPKGSQDSPRISNYIPQNITIGERFRTVKEEAIQVMMVSIQKIGLRTPITVRETEDDILLVAGCCRLQAILRLGWTDVLAFVVSDDAAENEVRLWEIAENLHRQDLTAQERSEHIAEWVKLTEDKLGQVAQVSNNKGGRGKEGGLSAAVRDLGIERTEARRSVTIAGMQPEAKEAARQHGLDDNQSALLAVAKAPPDQQVAKVQEIADQKAAKKAADRNPADDGDDRRSANQSAPTPVERDVVDLAIDAILGSFKLPQFQLLQEKIADLPGSLERRLLSLSFSQSRK